MSSDSHSDDHGHDSHDSHAHPVATDVIPETSLQDMLLKVLTICAAVLLYGMAFWWMSLPVAEASHEAGSEHSEHTSGSSVGSSSGSSSANSEQNHGSEHSEEHH
jgi:hypothetical protein